MRNRDFAVLLLSMLLIVGGASLYVATYDTDYEVTYGGTDETDINAVVYDSLNDEQQAAVDAAIAEGTIVVEDQDHRPPGVVKKDGQAHLFKVRAEPDFGEAQNVWHPVGGLVTVVGFLTFGEALRREYRPWWKPWRRFTGSE
jgi:hypothetical protein